MKLSRFSLIALYAIILSSCSSNKDSLVYFADIESTPQSVNLQNYSVKIQDADELFISVTSTVPSATKLFNLPLENPAKLENLGLTTQPQQQTYIVNEKGDINFPQLGMIHVAGMTTEELRNYLTERISETVEDPIVKVELVNFVVNVAGEVLTPGRIKVSSERFSVLDALTAAGDLTPYGVRDNVLIIREENGKRTYTRLNLTQAESLNSPYFYLKQNDYVYVEPSTVRQDNAEYNQTNAFKLSIISTIVSACSVVVSLIIALATR